MIRRSSDLASVREVDRGPELEVLRAVWLAQVEVLRDPDCELTAEEFAALWSTFVRLRRLGESFDPALIALVEHLNRQAAETDDNTDRDDGALHTDDQWLPDKDYRIRRRRRCGTAIRTLGSLGSSCEDSQNGRSDAQKLRRDEGRRARPE